MASLRTAFTLLLILGTGAACGGKGEPAPAEADAAALVATPPPAPKPALPQTEEELVRAFTAALAARDLDALSALAAPELAADLRRMHGQDADAFWGRGQRWVDNVNSGFKVAAKQDGREDNWRALLQFDNGSEETVRFTRVDGKLLFLEL